MVKKVLLLILVLNTSCTHLKVRRGDGPVTAAVPSKSIKLHGFAWGIIEGPRPGENELCPQSKVESLLLNRTAGDVLLSLATCGIYFPQTVQVTCKNL